MDAEGRPVFDLTPEEVRLTVDGEPVPFDTFDRYATRLEALPGEGETAPATATAAPPPVPRAPGG